MKTTSINLPALNVFGMVVTEDNVVALKDFKAGNYGIYKVIGRRNIYLVVPTDILVEAKWKIGTKESKEIPKFHSGFRVSEVPQSWKKYLVRYVKKDG